MNREKINTTAEMASEHGINREEWETILKILGRKPTYEELGIFSAMWSEHCSYKSSKIHLGKLHTKAEWVLVGPGENAGVVDIEMVLQSPLKWSLITIRVLLNLIRGRQRELEEF